MLLSTFSGRFYLPPDFSHPVPTQTLPSSHPSDILTAPYAVSPATGLLDKDGDFLVSPEIPTTPLSTLPLFQVSASLAHSPITKALGCT